MTETIRTADLCDAHPDTMRVFLPGLQSFGGVALFHGPCVTLRTVDDNSVVKDCLGEPGEGRVLVIDNAGSLRRALVGGNLAELGAKNGWAGLIVNGAIRDRHELAEIEIGVLALASVSMKTDKRGIGTLGVPVSVRGVTVDPGDWIYADLDGVVSAPHPVHDTHS
jgi:regulator of ribonuclease activity A